MRLYCGCTVKLYSEPISLNSTAKPPVFVWRGQRYRVLRLVDWWVVQGRWWTAEEKRRVYLVQARSEIDEGYYEIAHSSNRSWLLIRVYD